MSDSRPVWLLDVDGVINCSRPAGWGERPAARSVWVDGDIHRIRWQPELVRRIRTVHNAGLAEIRWCTTWCGKTRELAQLLRLPDFADALACEVNDDRKRAAALGVLADERRSLVWTDDRAIPLEFFNRRLTSSSELLMIKPRTTRGLQPEHMEWITEFCHRVVVKNQVPTEGCA